MGNEREHESPLVTKEGAPGRSSAGSHRQADRLPSTPPLVRGAEIDEAAETLEYEQWLSQSVEEVFAFFCNPYNLEAITPEFLRFKVLRCSDEAIREGTIIDYRLSLHGIPIRWQSRIEEWVPGVRFVDRQLRGPYALWHHTHEFEPHRSGTIVRDRVRYRVPFGVLGKLVAGALVRRDVRAIFDHRRRRMCELLPTHDRSIEGKEGTGV